MKNVTIVSDEGVEYVGKEIIIPVTHKVMPANQAPHGGDKDAWIRFAETPLTFEEYMLFCMDTGRGVPRDEGWGRGTRPVIHVSAIDACEYCNWLNEKIGELPNDKGEMVKLTFRYIIDGTTIRIGDPAAKGFRLPFQEEWLKAAEDLIYTDESDGNIKFRKDLDPNEWAWTNQNSNQRTQPVGQKRANKYGLKDLIGLVYEFAFSVREEKK